MVTFSAFADEIDPDPKVQMDTLEANGVKQIELRGAWDINVMKLNDDQCRELKQMLDERGFQVACIGSPIGKVTVDSDLSAHFEDFKHACHLAEFFESGRVRLFSYYPPEGGSILDHRNTVIEHLQQMCDYVADKPVTLVLENESKLYGEKPAQLADLMDTLRSDKLTMAFDPANFVHGDIVPVYENAWLRLKQYVGYFHIKDMVRGASGPCVPAGEGDGDIEKILADAQTMGYDGILALEPHLAEAGQFKGSTGTELFSTAVTALKGICDRVGLEY